MPAAVPRAAPARAVIDVGDVRLDRDDAMRATTQVRDSLAEILHEIASGIVYDEAKSIRV